MAFPPFYVPARLMDRLPKQVGEQSRELRSERGCFQRDLAKRVAPSTPSAAPSAVRPMSTGRAGAMRP
jgi:hypothetical protein